jgi:hypothetical protein
MLRLSASARRLAGGAALLAGGGAAGWAALGGDRPAGVAACEAAAAADLPLRPPSSSAVALAELRRWLEAGGADLAGLEIRRGGADGAARLGAFATAEGTRRAARGALAAALGLGAGDAELAHFPLSRALTAGALAAADPALRELLEGGALDARAAVALHLAVERGRGRASPLGPWLAALPATFDTPPHWTDGELAALRGTSLARAAAARRRALAAAWRRLEPAAAALTAVRGGGRRPTFEDYVWADSVFWSRAISFPCPAHLPAAGGSGGSGESGGAGAPTNNTVVAVEGIIPGLDFCNHAAGARCRWTVFGGRRRRGWLGGAPPPEAVRLVCRRGAGADALKAGAEVCIDYGARGNEELLFLHGFVDESAGAAAREVLMLPCPLPPPAERDARLRARLELLAARGLAPQVFLPAAALPAEGAAARPLWRRLLRLPAAPREGPVAEAELPPGVMATLEVFVMEPAAVAAELGSAAEAEAAGAGPASVPAATADAARAGRRDAAAAALARSGLRMALLTALARLLEAAVDEMEGSSSGTGSLEADVALLEAAGNDDNNDDNNGGASAALPPRVRAAVVYRAGQKRLARAWLARADALLAREMRHLRGLAAAAGEDDV